MKRLLTTALLAATAVAAHAKLSYDTTGDYLPAIEGNDVPSFASGLVDPLISTAKGGTLSVTFLGKEAGHQNLFGVYGLTTLEILNTAAPGSSGVVQVGTGNLPLRFLDLADGTSAPNGGNGAGSQQGSYVVFGTMGEGGWKPLRSYGGGKFDLIIGWNDGARVDADFDDHVLGLTLAPVPEPGSYALLLAGLATVGFVARRRLRD
jgi:hypothetical protein